MIRRWLIALIILLACSVAAGAEKPHIVIFSTSPCSPCNRLKQDFAVSPNLTPIAQAAWVSYLAPSDSRAKAYGFTGMVPLIVVLEPTDRGTYQECYRQVGYDGDAAKLSQNLYGCGLLRRLLGRDRSPRPGPNPGPGPTPDGDGDTIPIPDEGGKIPIPGDGPAPNPADDPVVPVTPVTPGCTPQPCPADCDCRLKLAEIDARLVNIEAVIANLSQGDPPQQSGISHLVIVRNKAADYWPRLEAELQTARGHFSAIEESDPPTKFSVALPQLVAYRDGVPVYVAKGIRDVSDALRAIARDEFLVPFSKGAASGS